MWRQPDPVGKHAAPPLLWGHGPGASTQPFRDMAFLAWKPTQLHPNRETRPQQIRGLSRFHENLSLRQVGLGSLVSLSFLL